MQLSSRAARDNLIIDRATIKQTKWSLEHGTSRLEALLMACERPVIMTCAFPNFMLRAPAREGYLKRDVE